jgi:hypothetical protein
MTCTPSTVRAASANVTLTSDRSGRGCAKSTSTAFILYPFMPIERGTLSCLQQATPISPPAAGDPLSLALGHGKRCARYDLCHKKSLFEQVGRATLFLSVDFKSCRAPGYPSAWARLRVAASRAGGRPMLVALAISLFAIIVFALSGADEARTAHEALRDTAAETAHDTTAETARDRAHRGG